MSKLVKKIKVQNLCCIGEYESWLSDLAKQGLHLKKMGVFFLYFEKGEPAQTQYRIDFTEQKISYIEQGWHFETGDRDWAVFSWPKAHHFEGPEIKADALQQSALSERLKGKSLSMLVGIVVAVMGLIMPIFTLIYTDTLQTPVLRTATGGVISEVYIVAIFIYLIWISASSAQAIDALRKALLKGEDYHQPVPWQRKRRTGLLAFSIALGLVVLNLVNVTFELTHMETKTLTDGLNRMPIVRLSDVENTASLMKRPFPIDDVDWANRCTKRGNFLVPQQFEATEHTVAINKRQLEGKLYAPIIETVSYQFAFSPMSKRAAEEWLLKTQHDYIGPQPNYQRENRSGFDLLLVSKKQHQLHLIASKGRGFIYVSYYGLADLETLIAAVSDKLTLIE